MIKQVQFRGVSATGEINCLPLLGATPSSALEKTAAASPSKLHPAVQKFVRAVRPTPEGVYVLVNALGAGEYWGSNVNGDLFPEAALIHAPPDWESLSTERMKEVGKTWDYGFPTFMNAYPYKHHVNKDPSRAFGEVVMAVWNPEMHRVELVVYLDRAKCKKWAAYDVIERIERGEFPDVSMGCKVPFDVCTICGHKSKTRKDYCTHAAQQMNKILPDGRKVAVRNDNPRFFDISFVFIGADKSAKVLAKLAHQNNQVCMGDYCTIPRLSADVGESYTPVELQEKLATESWEEAFLEKAAGAKTELAGLGLLAVPSALHLANKKLPPKIEAGLEVAGLGVLAAPYVKKLLTKTKVASCSCDGICDPCGGSFEKFAEAIFPGVQQKSASHSKLSEIIKDVPAGPFFEKDLPRVEKAEADLPDHVLDHLAKQKLEDALAAPSSLGMVLKPREFQRIILIQVGERPLADKLDSMGQVFGHTDEVDPLDLSPLGNVGEEIKKILLPFLAARSCATPLLKRRITIVARKRPSASSSTPISGDEVMDKVAALYNGYRRDLVKKAAVVETQLVTDPQLLNGIAGGSIAQAFGGGFGKTASASVLGPESLAYLVGAHYPDRDFHAKALTQSGATAVT